MEVTFDWVLDNSTHLHEQVGAIDREAPKHRRIFYETMYHQLGVSDGLSVRQASVKSSSSQLRRRNLWYCLGSRTQQASANPTGPEYQREDQLRFSFLLHFSIFCCSSRILSIPSMHRILFPIGEI